MEDHAKARQCGATIIPLRRISDHRVPACQLCVPTAKTDRSWTTAYPTAEPVPLRSLQITLAPTVQLFVEALNAHGIAYGHGHGHAYGIKLANMRTRPSRASGLRRPQLQ